MKKPGASEADLEEAALDALGALGEAERAELAAKIAREPSLGEERAGFRAVAEELARSVPPVAPRPEARERLLAEIARTAEAAPPSPDPRAAALPPFYFAHSGELPWSDLGRGASIKLLTPGAKAGGRAFLLRLDPGGTVVEHPHRFAEHCYVLSGEVSVLGEELRPGDYHLAAAGTTHRDFTSGAGCLLLIVDGPPLSPAA